MRERKKGGRKEERRGGEGERRYVLGGEGSGESEEMRFKVLPVAPRLILYLMLALVT